MKINREKLTNHTYMCFGAGTAGAGIADRIFREMVAQGLSEKKHEITFIWWINRDCFLTIWMT